MSGWMNETYAWDPGGGGAFFPARNARARLTLFAVRLWVAATVTRDVAAPAYRTLVPATRMSRAMMSMDSSMCAPISRGIAVSRFRNDVSLNFFDGLTALPYSASVIDFCVS